MKEKVKLLDENYDYYKSVKEKSDKLAIKIFGKNDEILKARLYNLVLNLCNQVIYDFTYVLTKDDLFLIADYNINVYKLLDNFVIDICKIKEQIEQDNNS